MEASIAAAPRRLPLLLFALLSGGAALIYETAWTERFALVFGASELAIATVLAAYMAGLTVGALAAARWVDRLRRPLAVYALLEAGIAGSALLVPAALEVASRLQVTVLGGLDIPPSAGSLSSALFYLIAAFVILLVPTALMGATLPILARSLVRLPSEVGPRVAQLYTANTAGAAAGTLAAAYLLLPEIGLGNTLFVAAAINLLVAGLAAPMARKGAREVSKAADPEGARGVSATATDSRERARGAPPGARKGAREVSKAADPEGARGVSATATDSREGAREVSARGLRKGARGVFAAGGGSWVLPLVLVASAVSFSWEVLWTRLLSHVLGGSLYAFGTMLATFLCGIALGAGLAAPWARARERARTAFALSQLGVGITSLGAFWLVDRVAQTLGGGAMGGGGYLLRAAPLAAVTLLPAAIFIGAGFPLAVRIVAGSTAAAGTASARVLAWSTVGAVAGALGTGFGLLPALRLAGTATVAVAASLALTLAAALLPRPRRIAPAAMALVAIVGLIAVPPPTPWRLLRASPLAGGSPLQGEVEYYGVGRSATVLLLEQGGNLRLTTNGLPEAAIPPPGSRAARFHVARWLSMLPVLARPEARSMLVIGLGAGLTLEAVPASIEKLHLVELEPEVLAANRIAADRRSRDPLADPRLEIHINDARSALLLASRRFDLIVSQPSHPWTAGAAHLFTREFFALAKERLEPDGVLMQWIGLQFVDADLLRTLVATLGDVFPQVEVYQPFPGGAALFLCSAAPLELPETAEAGLEAAHEAWRGLGVLTPEDVLIARVLDAEGSRRFAAGASLSTDSRNRIQTGSPRVLGAAIGGRAANRLFAEHDPLPAAVAQRYGLYVVQRLLELRSPDRARRVARALEPPERELGMALADAAIGRRQLAEPRLWRILAADGPASPLAANALLQLRRRALVQGSVPPPLLARHLELDPAAAAVLEGWRLLRLRSHRELEHLEPTLAAIGPRHLLFGAATNLRIAWRSESGQPPHAREALALLDPLLAAGPSQPGGLVRRAELARRADEPEAAVASLEELAQLLRRRPRLGRLARPALATLEALPEPSRQGERYVRVHTRLTALLPAAAGG